MTSLIIKVEIDGLENWDVETNTPYGLRGINNDVQLALSKAGFGYLNNIKVTSEIL